MATKLVRALMSEEADAVLALYRLAAESGTLGRDADEYDIAEVAHDLAAADHGGFYLGAFIGDELAGVIRASRLKPRRFHHVVSGLTAAVHPSHQGQGVGRTLFVTLLSQVDALDPSVTRVELMLQAGNAGALRLYRSLGFEEEGRLRGRVRSPDGTSLDDIIMARLQPPLA